MTNNKALGLRTKHALLLQPATVPSAIREEPTIPFASALLVPVSQIEREHRVQSELERQLDLERQQLELDRQRLELVQQQEQLRERQELERQQQDPQLKLEQQQLELERQQRQQLEEQLALQRQVLEQLLGVANQPPQPPPPATTNEQQQQQQEPTTVAENDGSGSKKRWIARTIVASIVVCFLAGGRAAAFVGICGTSGNCRGSSPQTRSSSIRSYINNITLTGRSLQYLSSASAEERALLWLIDVDRGTSESDTIVLRQRYALATIWFQTTTGFARSGWTTDIKECDWEGVGCDDAGRVTDLNLFNDGVEGRIPADLGLLTALTYLDLGGNELTGSIPSSIGLLTALNSLDLSYNALNGTIPTTIGSLTALNSLWLFNNGLTGTMPFCDSVSNQSFDRLVADCEKLSCPCCTHCCPTSRDGIPVWDYCELQ